MTTFRKPMAYLMALVTVVAAGGAACRGQAGETRETLSVVNALGSSSDPTGFARVTGPRAFVFPADHGPHPSYRTEWWYYTGNVEDDTGRRFGYQMTLFRQALTPAAPSDGSSGWRTNQLYLGHLAVGDPETNSFYTFERLSRGGAGLAGATSEPFRVWLEDWEVGGVPDQSVILRAGGGPVRLELTVFPEKPMVLQGDGGFDAKGAEPGQASHYYSYTRLRTSGSLVIDGRSFEVKGYSWMDREWSTSALGSDQVGWDWFSLQLSNQREVMYYQLRKADGTADRFSHGVAVGPSAETEPFKASDVMLTVLDSWTSPHSGATYPSGWRLVLEDRDVDLTITPVMLDQEMNVSVRYWEGAVDVSGRFEGETITGRGFVELTGYAAASR